MLIQSINNILIVCIGTRSKKFFYFFYFFYFFTFLLNFGEKKKIGVIKKAGDFIRKGEVKIISHTETKIVLQVGEKIVIRKKEAGRQVDSCSCINHSRNCNINPRCAHKDSATTYLVMRSIEP